MSGNPSTSLTTAQSDRNSAEFPKSRAMATLMAMSVNVTGVVEKLDWFIERTLTTRLRPCGRAHSGHL